MRKTLSRIFAVSVCMAMFLTGCSGSTSNNNTTSKDKATASATSTETKDEIHIAVSANPPTLDTQISNSNIVGEIANCIYEPLFAIDENYEAQPVLAESYSVSDDGKEYTIKVRQDVKFHNGDEMTADDVVASMNRWIKKSPKANTLIGDSKFEKVDDYTVKMTVKKASSDIMNVLANPVMFGAIYPAKVVEADTDAGITEYIGTGPYKLAEWKQDQYIKLERNDDYKANDNATSGLAVKKTAATKTIYFDFVPDASTRIAGAKSGQYDIVEEIPLDNYEEVSKEQNLKLEVTKGGTLNLFLNTTEGIMANKDMRQAILAALNCDDILLACYGNEDLYEKNPGWFTPSDTQWGTDSGKEYYNQNNPDKAKELLKKAGYNNEELLLVTTPDYPEMYNATLVIQEELKNVGINAKVDSYDFSTFMEHRSNPKQFSMYVTSNSYNVLPIQLSVLDKGWAGLDAKEVTDGISAIRYAKSTEDASNVWKDLQGFLYEYGAASVLGHYTNVNALNKNVQNYEFLRFPIYSNVTVAK